MRSAGMDEKNAMELSYQMHDQFKTEAEKTVRAFLLFKKIAEKEAITVSKDDIDNHIKDLSEIHHVDIDSVKKIYEDEEKKESLMAEILQKKVFDFIEQRANINVVEKIGMGEEAVE
jgi:trigger factor